MNANNPSEKSSIGKRFTEELHAYVLTSFYLWICFSALMLYKDAILRADNVHLLPLGTAALKALVLGKFILIGKALKAESRAKHNVLLNRIAWKSAATLLMLLVLTAIEELIAGMIHGQTAGEIFTEFADRSWIQNIAPSFVMLLVLIPMISFEEIDRTLGKGSLKRMLLSKSDHGPGE